MEENTSSLTSFLKLAVSKKVILTVIVILFISFVFALAFSPRAKKSEPSQVIPPTLDKTKTQPSDNPVACAQDAKLCPDGSYVSRHPPTCDFDPCPGKR